MTEQTEPRRGPMASLIEEWKATREAIAAIERAEHPDITDALGRTWVWMSGGARDRDGNDSSSIYTHDGIAWPRELIERSSIGWPTLAAIDNPNYRWCDACRQGAARQAEGRPPTPDTPGQRGPIITVTDPLGRI